MDRQANSQAGWALITQGVTEARVQVHRLRHLLNRLISVSRDPRYSEILNRLLGDIISVAPGRVDDLEVVLDRTSYALSMMGEEHLKGRLPLKDLTEVEEAVEGSTPFSGPQERSGLTAEKLARWHLRRISVRHARSAG